VTGVQTCALPIFIAGFIIGLGAVTVIDLHGFLGRKSSYWTEATIRTHKITKPLIWIGIFLAILGGLITYRDIGFSGTCSPRSCIDLKRGIPFLLGKSTPFKERERGEST
jgi:hypothetical protein